MTCDDFVIRGDGYEDAAPFQAAINLPTHVHGAASRSRSVRQIPYLGRDPKKCARSPRLFPARHSGTRSLLVKNYGQNIE